MEHIQQIFENISVEILKINDFEESSTSIQWLSK